MSIAPVDDDDAHGGGDVYSSLKRSGGRGGRQQQARVALARCRAGTCAHWGHLEAYAAIYGVSAVRTLIIGAPHRLVWLCGGRYLTWTVLFSVMCVCVCLCVCVNVCVCVYVCVAVPVLVPV
jgi:hypothetical protein